MANFYWRGQYRAAVTGLSAFDFNEPSNWLNWTDVPAETGCVPMTTTGDGKIVIAVTPSRGIGINNYGVNEEGSGFGWGGTSNLCRVYTAATRAPGPGDVVVVGDDIPMGQTPLLFGGFSGDENGGVWLNGADNGSGGYTHAVGGTLDSSLAAFYFGGMGNGHPDFNYPWQRMGGGFTAHLDTYGPYTKSPQIKTNYADFLWKVFFFQGATAELVDPDGTINIFRIDNAIFPGATWSAGELTKRTETLNIKADYIEEAIRSYTGIPIYSEMNVVKNIRPATDPITSSVYYRVITDYKRYSRNVTSFLSGYFNSIQNASSDSRFADWNGEVWADSVHDLYHMTPDEVLVLNGVTAGSIRTYIPDPITISPSTVVGSVHIDDQFALDTDSVWCLNYTRYHNIQGDINVDLCLTDLGLTGTAEGKDLDSTLLVRAKTRSFIPQFIEADRGTFNVFIGNNVGNTIDIDRVWVDVMQTLPSSDPASEHRPATVSFNGTATININKFDVTYGNIQPGTNLSPDTKIVIGYMKLGQGAWFFPNLTNHANWYFGTRYSSAPGNFLGGIQFMQEANTTDSDYTSEFILSPYFRLHNALVGFTQATFFGSPRGAGSAQYIANSIKGNLGGV